jgi:hypothetical protein
MVQKLLVLIVVVCLPASLLADFSYDTSTKMTGGAMMGMMRVAGAFSKQLREPIQSNVALKGNKMVHGSKDHASIIDLDNETITAIDFQKKTYSVMTFAEMTQAMENAMQQMKDKKNEAKADFKVSVKSTGATKQIGPYSAKELLMTMTMEGTDEKSGQKGGMLINTSIWIAPKISGYDEVREFYKKMGAKMAWTPGGAGMAAGRPDLAKGMAEVMKEAAKLDGMQLLQVMKMQPTVDGQPVAAPPSGSSSQTSSQQSKPAETPSISGALAGRLGGFGGFGRKKKQEEPKKETATEQANPEPAAAGDTSATLMEMTTESTNFSSAAVDPSKFAVPSGFKKVDSDLQRRAR